MPLPNNKAAPGTQQTLAAKAQGKGLDPFNVPARQQAKALAAPYGQKAAGQQAPVGKVAPQSQPVRYDSPSSAGPGYTIMAQMPTDEVVRLNQSFGLSRYFQPTEPPAYASTRQLPPTRPGGPQRGTLPGGLTSPAAPIKKSPWVYDAKSGKVINTSTGEAVSVEYFENEILPKYSMEGGWPNDSAPGDAEGLRSLNEHEGYFNTTYDPATGTWTQAGEPGTGNNGLAPDGTVGAGQPGTQIENEDKAQGWTEDAYSGSQSEDPGFNQETMDQVKQQWDELALMAYQQGLVPLSRQAAMMGMTGSGSQIVANNALAAQIYSDLLERRSGLDIASMQQEETDYQQKYDNAMSAASQLYNMGLSKAQLSQKDQEIAIQWMMAIDQFYGTTLVSLMDREEWELHPEKFMDVWGQGMAMFQTGDIQGGIDYMTKNLPSTYYE